MSFRIALGVHTIALAFAVVVVSARSAPPALSRGDIRWLNRVSFGIDAAVVARYQRLGREKFLDAQLHPSADPPELAAELAALRAIQQAAADRIRANRAEQLRINALTSEDDKQKARTALSQA